MYTWTPALIGGEYEVYACWPGKAQHNENATYTITHNDTTSNVIADQPCQGGKWNLLGTFSFSGDGSESIAVEDTGDDTAADAVRFQQTSGIQGPLITAKRLSDGSGALVWKADELPFGTVSPDEDLDGNGEAVVFNLRFPGQYGNKETGLHYNYVRSYDS